MKGRNGTGDRRFDARGNELGWRLKKWQPFLVTKKCYDNAIEHKNKEAQYKAFKSDVGDLKEKLKKGYHPFIEECKRLMELAKVHLN